MQEITAQTGSREPELLSLDLGDLDSVRAYAREFLARGEPLHVLINNAGLAGKRGKTASGVEAAFGTNHVGPFLLTSLLPDRIRESAPARIVNVASAAHYGAPGIDFLSGTRFTEMTPRRAPSGESTLPLGPPLGPGVERRVERQQLPPLVRQLVARIAGFDDPGGPQLGEPIVEDG
jgi:NAD(P)-dependent dehydrogenase (short-subunit alcohol dehydrogenase family)